MKLHIAGLNQKSLFFRLISRIINLLNIFSYAIIYCAIFAAGTTGFVVCKKYNHHKTLPQLENLVLLHTEFNIYNYAA